MSKRAAARLPLPNALTTRPTTTASCTTDATPLTRNPAPAASWAAFLQYYALRQQFEEAGFQQYEVSNFARPGRESLHNSRYWDRTPYLGLGPGAHSFDGHKRRWNLPDNQLYISTLTSNTSNTRNYYAEETLAPADAHNELLMTALRTTRGLPLSAVKEEHRPHLISAMQRYIACGWIAAESDGNQQFFRPTSEGLLHADGMAATLFV